MGGAGAVLADELDRARSLDPSVGTAVLVEGASDRAAVQRLAERMRRELWSEGVVVLAIAGATNVERFIGILGPSGRHLNLAGLCDRAEAPEFANALRQAGIDERSTPATLNKAGFFVCDGDLEEELIRSVGPKGVLEVMRGQGQLRSFRRFQNQPAQREKSLDAQIWRWMGNHKIRYASLLVDALDLDRVPPPLSGLLGHI